MGKATRIWNFIKAIFKWWVAFTVLLLNGLIGLVQILYPLLFSGVPGQEGGNTGVIKTVFLFFVGPWSWYWWVIVILGSFVIVLVLSLWRLGGFGLELGLALSSKPLPNSVRRYVGLHIENKSPKKIKQLLVRLVDIKNESDSKWKSNEMIARKDRFLWSAYDGPVIGTKELVPGYEVVADLMWMGNGLNISVLTLQIAKQYLFLVPGNYRMFLEFVGIYNGRRFAIPIDFSFVYRGDLKFDSVCFAYDKAKSWQINKNISVNIMSTTIIDNTNKMREEVEQWIRTN